MPRLAPKPVKLEDDESQELEKILARHSTSQQIAKRAKIIVMAAQGKNHRCGRSASQSSLAATICANALQQENWESVEKWQDCGVKDG